jgi:hypothetical protein
VVVFSQPDSVLLAFSCSRFLDHTQRRATVGRTPGRVINPSQRPLPDTTQRSLQTNIHATGEIRTNNISRRAAEDLRLRPRGHWDRHLDISYPIQILLRSCRTNHKAFSQRTVNTRQHTYVCAQCLRRQATDGHCGQNYLYM